MAHPMTASVPGHQTSISPVVQSLMHAMKQTGCAAEREFEIETALREALANAAVHGCGNDPSKIVECELSCDESGEVIHMVLRPARTPARESADPAPRPSHLFSW